MAEGAVLTQKSGQGLRVPQHMALGFAELWLTGFSPRSCPQASVALGVNREKSPKMP